MDSRRSPWHARYTTRSWKPEASPPSAVSIFEQQTLRAPVLLQRFLAALERKYHALQQWEEARSILIEAGAVGETLGLGRLQALSLSQLCMNYGVTGEWEAAYHYAVQAIAIRKRAERALSMLHFSRQYET